MTDRALFWRCIMRLAHTGGKIGLTESELAILLVQAGLDHMVHIAKPSGAAAWLRHWASDLESDPRGFRGEGYAWLDRR